MAGLVAFACHAFLFPIAAQAAETFNALKGKKILWVNSYHRGYPWSDETERGIRNTLAGKGIILDVIHMDAKHKPDKKSQEAAGLRVNSRIESLRPDLVIASDDPAQAYAVLPHILGKSIPVVFTGINWDATPYGYPRPGVTGMIEVLKPITLVEHMRTLAKANRFALIGADDGSVQKNIDHLKTQKHLFADDTAFVTVKSYEAFQRVFLELQKTSDAIVLLNITTLPGWDKKKSRVWVENNTRIPTGTVNDWMADLALITVSKTGEEQGEFAGKAAIRILRGTVPESIPIVSNERSTLLLNQTLAVRLNITFPLRLLRAANAKPAPN